MVIMTPADENETRIMLSTAYNHKGPASVRYPRGSGPNIKVDESLTEIEIGKARLIREGSADVIFLNFGSLLHEARKVSENLNLTLIDMRFVKRLDKDFLRKYLTNAKLFISLEDGSVAGGAGSSIQEFCSEENILIKSKLLGIPDKFIEHASRDEMIKEVGLTSMQIEKSLRQLM